MKVIVGYAVACGIVGTMPLSSPLLILLEIAMMIHLSLIHRNWIGLAGLMFVSPLLAGASVTLKAVSESLLNWFPGPGWIVKGGIAFSFVMGAGLLVDFLYRLKPTKHEANARTKQVQPSGPPEGAA
jgi:hypothetical protein